MANSKTGKPHLRFPMKSEAMQGREGETEDVKILYASLFFQNIMPLFVKCYEVRIISPKGCVYCSLTPIFIVFLDNVWFNKEKNNK